MTAVCVHINFTYLQGGKNYVQTAQKTCAETGKKTRTSRSSLHRGQGLRTDTRCARKAASSAPSASSRTISEARQKTAFRSSEAALYTVQTFLSNQA